VTKRVVGAVLLLVLWLLVRYLDQKHPLLPHFIKNQVACLSVGESRDAMVFMIFLADLFNGRA
jgi:hypothetical protein